MYRPTLLLVLLCKLLLGSIGSTLLQADLRLAHFLTHLHSSNLHVNCHTTTIAEQYCLHIKAWLLKRRSSREASTGQVIPCGKDMPLLQEKVLTP